ncbi:hypothetical protein DWB79_05955 [Treponema medium]|uniref:Uncharacterized protein n=2 Tax=Treponema medium TaxID=58231 RepID=A0AA87NQY7_TREMD|nr:hypothetical protein [Treponema medium]EPF28934.1 hypothetical protein HMPREF9195_01175 [Treponema medium ATCC 700293]QSH97297.1 hypothetical protein DWB79_05955 [Treponema medium]
MAVSVRLPDILRTYALRFNSPFVGISELTDYLRKYAQRNIAEKPDVASFIDISETRLLTELEALESEGKVELIDDKRKGKVVFVPFYFLDKVARQYETIREKPELPFPLASAIPQNFSKRFLRYIRINTDFTELQPEVENDTFLYQLMFPDDTPPLIFPGNFSTDQMLDLAIAKLRFFFQKDELRDFIQKKLITANPGKEYSIRKFILTIQAHSSEAMYTLKKSGDVYLYWSYLCSVVKQEFSKKTEKLSDEITILQAIFIIEYLNNYYRNKTQQALQRETALKNLDLALQKPPYYFNKAAIVNFKDSRGVPLLGQYSQEDLEEYIRGKTSSDGDSNLPDLLSFKTPDGERYYIMLDKTVPLIISLVNDNRKKLRDVCLKKWYQQLIRFEQTEAMHTDSAFNQLLKTLCAEYVPILYALLGAPFIPMLSADKRITEHQAAEIRRIFSRDRLLSYTDLFMMNRQELLTDAKILLPFWYTIPIISSIIAFFMRPRKSRHTTRTGNSKTGSLPQQPGTTNKKVSPREIASELQAEFIPANKSLQDCIIEQLDLWNTIIDPVIRKQNTEDVNSFIRDQVKIAHRTQSFLKLTSDRIRNLADAIVSTPGLAKVKNKGALRLYTEYYILWLVLHSV